MFGYQTILDFAPFNTVYSAFNIPTSLGTPALGFYRFGDALFNTIMASLGFGSKIGTISLGIKLNYLQYQIDRFGKKGMIVAEMGAIGPLGPRVNFGMHIYNFTQTVISETSQEKIPVILRLSLHYLINTETHLYSEVEQIIERGLDLRMGIAHKILKELELRTGFSTETNLMTFGAGLNISRITVDYGIKANKTISATHNFGLTYRIIN
jgi:hypothetical protein